MRYVVLPEDDERGWWALPDDVLMTMLLRVKHGESPDLVYAEYFANVGHADREARDDA